MGRIPILTLVALIIIALLGGCESPKEKEEKLNHAYEEGRQQGLEEGEKKGYLQGKEDGKQLGHEDGYKQGHIEGYKQGHDEGYKEGLEECRPGVHPIEGVVKFLYQSIVWLGLIKIFFLLFVSMFILVKRNDSFSEFIGKLTFIAVGIVLIIAVFSQFKITNFITDILLAKPPETLGWQLILLSISFIIAYLCVEFLYQLLARGLAPMVEGWILMLLSAFWMVILSVADVFFNKVPDILIYLGAYFFAGALLGGLLWIARSSINGRISKAWQPRH